MEDSYFKTLNTKHAPSAADLMPRICSVLPSGGQKLSGTGSAYLVPVLLCAPSRRLVLVVKCEPQPPTPLLEKAAKVRG